MAIHSLPRSVRDIQASHAGLDGTCNSDPRWAHLYADFQSTAPRWTPPPGLALLIRWPDLREVPDEFLVPVARISALLWKKPRASHLINRILDGEQDEIVCVLYMLAKLGYIGFNLLPCSASANSGPMPMDAMEEPSAAAFKYSGLAAFVHKLRQRLLG